MECRDWLQTRPVWTTLVGGGVGIEIATVIIGDYTVDAAGGSFPWQEVDQIWSLAIATPGRTELTRVAPASDEVEVINATLRLLDDARPYRLHVLQKALLRLCNELWIVLDDIDAAHNLDDHASQMAYQLHELARCYSAHLTMWEDEFTHIPAFFSLWMSRLEGHGSGPTQGGPEREGGRAELGGGQTCR